MRNRALYETRLDQAKDLGAVDEVAFRRACSKFPTGVTVTTLLDQNGIPRGITVNSFTSVSLVPPLILVCIGQSSKMTAYWGARCYFGVNVLSLEQRNLSEQFSGKWEDRFSNVEWSPGQTGVPLISGVLAVFECKTAEVIPVGDHRIIIGHVVRVECDSKPPLTYADRSYGRLLFDGL